MSAIFIFRTLSGVLHYSLTFRHGELDGMSFNCLDWPVRDASTAQGARNDVIRQDLCR